jgi:hypothetical protein
LSKGTPLTTNQKVVVWARGKLGQKIGRGECWDLGEQALKQAGASTSNDLGPVEADTNYVWGDPISDISKIEPGDVLQIRDHLVTTTTTIEYTFQDGTVETEKKETTAKRGHHTAIVNGKLDEKGGVRTLEQHVKPRGDIVQNMYLPTRDVPEVVTKSIEQRRHPRTKHVERVSVVKSVTVKVTGSIWPYHPKPK